MKIIHIIPVLMSVMLLSACGGSSGGDDGDNSTPDVPPSTEMVPGGTPDSPAEMSLELRNEISSDSYYNYFIYKAKKGDKIYINGTLQLSDQAFRNCIAAFGASYADIRDEYSVQLTSACSENISYTFQADGTYTYHARYGLSGYFEAVVTHDNPVVSDLKGTYNLDFLPANNSPGGCSEGNGIMVINYYGSDVYVSVSGTINDVNTGEEITARGNVKASGFLEADLSFSFGSEGSMIGQVLTSGSGDGTWDDTSGCFGDWTATKY